MKNNRQELSKNEIACSHIESAIHLLFDNKPAISVYLLAHSAHEILADILEKKGMESLRKTNFENNELGLKTKGDFFKEYRKGLNFSKHADKDDPDDKLEFYDYYADIMIFTAIGDYHNLTNSITDTMQLFCSYFKKLYKEEINKKNGFEPTEVKYTERQRYLKIGKQKLSNVRNYMTLPESLFSKSLTRACLQIILKFLRFSFIGKGVVAD